LLRVDVARAASELGAVATTAAELDAVARAQAILKQPADGMAFAERALQREPNCRYCLDTHATLLFLGHRPEEALAIQERAIELMPERIKGSGLLERRRRYDLAVRAKAESPPAAPDPTPAPTGKN
jgi:hypothetical protein